MKHSLLAGTKNTAFSRMPIQASAHQQHNGFVGTQKCSIVILSDSECGLHSFIPQDYNLKKKNCFVFW